MLGRSFDDDVALTLDVELPIGFPADERLDDFGREPAQQDRLDDGCLPRFDPGEREQVVDDRGEALRLGLDVSGEVPGVLAVAGALAAVAGVITAIRS